MTRQECEEAIVRKLKEIREIVDQYDPGIDQVNMAVFKDTGWAFHMISEENGEPTNEYALNANWRADT